MRRTCLLGPVLFAISSCGPGAPPGGATDTDPSTGTTAGGSTTSTSGPPMTTDPGTTTATSPTTDTGIEPTTSTTGPAITTGSTSGATDATTDLATTSTTSTTGPMPVVEYAAHFWAGGLDHLTVRKADFGNDRCTEIGFALPGDVPRPGLQLPAQWFYQGAVIGQGAAGCLDFMAPIPGPGVGAELAEGVGTWDVDAFCPPFLDLDITLSFPPDPPWVPAEDVLLVAALPVQGC